MGTNQPMDTSDGSMKTVTVHKKKSMPRMYHRHHHYQYSQVLPPTTRSSLSSPSSVHSNSITPEPVNDDRIQSSNKRRRYQRRGSRAPSMFLLQVPKIALELSVLDMFLEDHEHTTAMSSVNSQDDHDTVESG